MKVLRHYVVPPIGRFGYAPADCGSVGDLQGLRASEAAHHALRVPRSLHCQCRNAGPKLTLMSQCASRHFPYEVARMCLDENGPAGTDFPVALYAEACGTCDADAFPHGLSTYSWDHPNRGRYRYEPQT